MTLSRKVRPHPIHWISNRDEAVMGRVERWRLPRAIRMWMIYSTRCGDGWLWYALVLFVLAEGGELRYQAATASVLAVIWGVVLFSMLKRICRRPRPRFAFLRAEGAPAPPDLFSFPSGHTITAFAMAVSLFHYYPAMAPVLLFAAASVAASRVLLGMHYPSDVVVGAMIGTGLGYAAFLLVGV